MPRPRAEITRRARTIVVYALAAVVLLAASLAYPATVPHAAHHAQHNAATHAHALCAWLCAAGQQAESPSWHFSAGMARPAGGPSLPHAAPVDVPLDVPSTRGPPARA